MTARKPRKGLVGIDGFRRVWTNGGGQCFRDGFTVGSDGVFEKFSFVSMGNVVFLVSLGVVFLFWVLQLNEMNLGKLCVCVFCAMNCR